VNALGFTYRFEPARDPACRDTLLLLHGTGGDENDLMPLAEMVAPDAARLSPRGTVLEHGMPRYFRRIAEGVFDLEDLRLRTLELGAFVEHSFAAHGVDPRHVVALGYSNGANIGWSLLLARPELLAGAALLRPMLPAVPAALPDLGGRRVLVVAGESDPIAPPEHAARLSAALASAGAAVTRHVSRAAHELVREDVEALQSWWNARG